jgi:hypothetical protein
VLRRPDVAAYLSAIRQAAAAETALSLAEIKSFCARVVRTPITKLDPDSDHDADLIKSYSVNEGEMGSSRRLEKHDPFKAIDIHLKITGEDSGTNALRDLAAAVASLGSASPIPDDQL